MSMYTAERDRRARENKKPRRIAFLPKNEKTRASTPKPWKGGKPHEKRVVIHPRDHALENSLDHYLWCGKVIQLYCPDCGQLLTHEKLASFSRKCMNDDCHFIGYKAGVPCREALSVDDHERARRERISRLGKARWNRPGYRERMAEKMKKRWTPEMRAEFSEMRKKICADPEYLEALSERMIEHWKDPEFRDKVSASMSERWEDPAFRAKAIKGMKLGWAKANVARKERLIEVQAVV